MTDTAAGPGFALPRGVEPGRAVVVGARTGAEARRHAATSGT